MFERPHLQTARLDLRVPQSADARAIYTITGNPETHCFLGLRETYSNHFGRFMRGAGSWMLYGYGFFMLREKGRDAVIGNCGIFHTYRGLGEDMDDVPEAGWVLSADHAGKGYAREAMEAVIAWFEQTHGPQRITAMIEPGNEASFALAGRLGFREFRRADMEGCEVVLLERVP